jgi:hydroxyacylglutathione hydrolase
MPPKPERVADGVWRLAGDIRGSMNVYYLEDEGGVTQYDAGAKSMTKDCARVSAELGGLKRIILGHSHTDHRGTAPGLDAPVLCHPAEREYAESDEWPDYWDMDEIDWVPSRLLYKHYLHRRWDGGAVRISGTVSEGDEIAGFRVIDLPGHAPGQIGLWRESDRVALVSDTVYLIDSIRLRPLPHGEVVVPHPVWNQDTRLAAESVRKLAALGPATILAGHEDPVSGHPDEIRAKLERAAEGALSGADSSDLSR